jgi:hypothetical protein
MVGPTRPERVEDAAVKQPPARAVALLVARPAHRRAAGLRRRLRGIPLGDATVGLVLTLRRPANPIGWLYAGPVMFVGGPC